MTAEDHTGGPVPCDQVGMFVDGELDATQAEAFRRHLVQCARCQSEMHALLQLAGLADEATRTDVRPNTAPAMPPPRQFWRRQVPRVAMFAAAAVAAGVFFWIRPVPEADLLAGLDSRPTEGWYARLYAERFRPYETSRGTEKSGEVFPLQQAAELARRKDWEGLGTLYALHHDWKKAGEALAKAPPTAETWSDLGLVRFNEGEEDAALSLLDRAATAAPASPLPRFNRGLVLAKLDLGLAAAEDFRAAASTSSGGWAQEAGGRDAAQSGRSERARQAWRENVTAQAEQIRHGTPWPGDLVRRYPDLARYSLLTAVVASGSRHEVAALGEQAHQLDQLTGDTSLQRLVKDVSARFGEKRAALAQELRKLILDQTLRLEEVRRQDLVRRVLAAGEPDQIVFLLNFLDVGASYSRQLAAAAARLDDPFWKLEAERYLAAAAQQRGELLEAERRLRVAFSGCSQLNLPSECALIGENLAEIYVDMQDLHSARAMVQRALDLARTRSLYSMEGKLLELRAEVELRAGRLGLANAILRETGLRARPLCDLVSYLRALAAKTQLARNDLEQARTEIAAAYGCRTTAPDLLRVGALMDLLEVGALQTSDVLDGKASASQLLLDDLAWIRRDPDSGPATLAMADAIQAQLALRRGDYDDALALVAHGKALTRPLLDSDRVASEARASLATVATLASALSGNSDAALQELATQVGTSVPSRCVVAAAQTLARRVWITRSAQGANGVIHEETLAGRTAPPEVLRAMSGCERIGVLAPAALQGVPNLLASELAWSYLGPGRTRHSSSMRSNVLIANPTPPTELGLPALLPLSPPREEGWRVLSGREATPARVLGELEGADYIDFEVHGFVDALVPDAARLALSQDTDGTYAISASTLARARLRNSPVVALGACHSARGSVLHPGPWNLPLAFLKAGASAVFASPAELPDAETPRFFAEVRERVAGGAEPEVALRDVRIRWAHELQRPWVNAVVVFRGVEGS